VKQRIVLCLKIYRGRFAQRAGSTCYRALAKHCRCDSGVVVRTICVACFKTKSEQVVLGPGLRLIAAELVKVIVVAVTADYQGGGWTYRMFDVCLSRELMK
jgi:hypothetical protein